MRGYASDRKVRQKDVKGAAPPGKKLRKGKDGEWRDEHLDTPESEWRKGSCEPPRDTRPPSAKIAKKPHLDANRFYVDDHRPVIQKKIAQTALEALEDYLQRRAFVQAVDNGATVEFAGKAHLGLNKSQSCEILKSMPDGPYLWFVRKVIDGLGSRKISGGRAVERSQMADYFYLEFAGGPHVWDSLRFTHGGRHKIMVKDELTEKDIITREVTNYGIFSRAFHNWKED
jgi:hypothetical protein